MLYMTAAEALLSFPVRPAPVQKEKTGKEVLSHVKAVEKEQAESEGKAGETGAVRQQM